MIGRNATGTHLPGPESREKRETNRVASIGSPASLSKVDQGGHIGFTFFPFVPSCRAKREMGSADCPDGSLRQ